jgi:hypothetical protein
MATRNRVVSHDVDRIRFIDPNLGCGLKTLEEFRFRYFEGELHCQESFYFIQKFVSSRQHLGSGSKWFRSRSRSFRVGVSRMAWKRIPILGGGDGTPQPWHFPRRARFCGFVFLVAFRTTATPSMSSTSLSGGIKRGGRLRPGGLSSGPSCLSGASPSPSSPRPLLTFLHSFEHRVFVVVTLI